MLSHLALFSYTRAVTIASQLGILMPRQRLHANEPSISVSIVKCLHNPGVRLGLWVP